MESSVFHSIPLMTQQPPVGQGLIIEVSRSHSDTPHSVRLLWTSDQPDAETSTLTTHNTHNRRASMTPAGFEPTIRASERSQTHASEGGASGNGISLYVASNVRMTVNREHGGRKRM